MIYKDKKWFLDNWNSIFNELLIKVIQFGYDKEEFLYDCDFKVGTSKYNEEMIKKGMRWFKLLDDYEPDVEYFEMDVEDRPKIELELLKEYEDMRIFRQSHPKKETEEAIKNRIKINMYNKRDIPISNYRQISNIDINIDIDKIKLIE